MRARAELFFQQSRFVSAVFFGCECFAVICGGYVTQEYLFRLAVKYNVVDIKEQIVSTVGHDNAKAEKPFVFDIKGLDKFVRYFIY